VSIGASESSASRYARQYGVGIFEFIAEIRSEKKVDKWSVNAVRGMWIRVVMEKWETAENDDK